MTRRGFTQLFTGSSASFAGLTGNPTDNTALAAALNAKLNTAGGTLTGALTLRNVLVDGPAAGCLQLGADHASVATAHTIKSHNVTTGTGASLILAGGTGSAAGGAVSLATSTTTGAPVARVTALANGDVTIGSTAGGYLNCSGNVITGGFGGSTSGRPSLALSAGAGSAMHASVGGISAADYFGVIQGGGASNVNIFGVFSTNTALTCNIGAGRKDATGSYTGAGHTTAVAGGTGSSVTTGGAGGALTLTGGAAAGSGNNNGGSVTISGGAPTGTGTRGNVVISNLPTSAAGLPTGAVWNNAGVLNIA